MRLSPLVVRMLQVSEDEEMAATDADDIGEAGADADDIGEVGADKDEL